MQRRDTNKQAQQPAAKQAMSTSKQLCSHTRAPVSRPVWKRDGTAFASNSGQFALRPRAVRSWWSYTAATVLTECGRCSIHTQQMLSQGDRATEHGQDGLSVARPHSCAWTAGRGKCAHLVGCESVVELLGGHSRGAACVFVARSARCVLPAVPKFLHKSFSWRCAGVRSLMCMSLSSPLSCMRGGGPTPNFYDPHFASVFYDAVDRRARRPIVERPRRRKMFRARAMASDRRPSTKSICSGIARKSLSLP